MYPQLKEVKIKKQHILSGLKLSRVRSHSQLRSRAKGMYTGLSSSTGNDAARSLLPPLFFVDPVGHTHRQGHVELRGIQTGFQTGHNTHNMQDTGLHN